MYERSASRASTDNVGDLAEGLLLQVLRGLVLALGEVDGDEFERDFLLVKNGSNTLGAGGDRAAVESEDHLGACVVELGDVSVWRNWEEALYGNGFRIVSSYIPLSGRRHR